MNKIYKVIWSQVANAFIAVSELASSRGKTKSTSTSASGETQNVKTFKLTKIAFLSSILFSLSNYATAAVNTDTLTVSGTSTFEGSATFNGGITTSSLTVNGKNVATEESLKTKLEPLEGKVNTLTNTVNSKADKTALDNLTTTVGTKADKTALDNLTTTVGTKADKTALDNLTTTVGTKADKTALDALTKTVGTNQANFSTLQTLFDTLALTETYSGIKYFRVNSNAADASATGNNSLAAGPKAKATHANSVAVGNDAQATDTQAVAVGHNTSSKADHSVSVGPSAYVEDTAKKGVAIGHKSQVGSKANGDFVYDGASAYVVGDGDSSIAIGNATVARGNRNIAIGKDALTANKDVEKQFAEDSIAFGTSAKTIASSKAIAIGNQAKVEKYSDSALAIGNQATSSAEKGLAIGSSSRATGNSAVAVGSSATASTKAVAIGSDTTAAGPSAVAIGDLAQALPHKTISIGLNAGQGQVADEVGTKHSHINIGEEAGKNVNGQLNIGIGYRAGSDVVGKGNIALGIDAGKFISSSEETLGENIAIGNNANSYSSKTAIQRSTAIGSQTNATQDATALGYNAKASGKQSIAAGFNANVTGDKGVAIGYSAQSDANNVALGGSSVAKSKSATSYLTAKQSSSVVSVGNNELSDPLLRRIVNVADGADEQDAVTVAQLKRVSLDVEKNVQELIKNLPQNQANSGINYDKAAGVPDQTVTLRDSTRISNVADAKLDGDAVNLRQLNQVVNSKVPHYFSTNDGGDHTGNYDNSSATGKLSMAIGQSVVAIAERSIAIGNDASAHGLGSIAIGALYTGSAELDDGTPQSSATNAAISNQDYKYGLAIGAGANTEGNNSIAIGSLAATSNKNISTGNVDRAIAIGYNAKSSAEKANAIGDRAVANSPKGNAFGSQAFSGAESSNAIGTYARVTGVNSIAFGTNTATTGANSGSIGYAGILSNQNATVVSGSGTYSLGNTNANISADESGVFGNNNLLSAKGNVRVVGNENIIGNIPTATSTGAIPVNNLANIHVSGYENKISSGKKVAKDLSGLFVYGHNNTVAYIADAESKDEIQILDSSVIGANNTLNSNGTSFFVLGNNVTATQDNSVYLGDGTGYVAKSATTSGMDNYTNRTDNFSGYTFAGGKPVGVVTVGAVGKERRIQNVAAGLVDSGSTDAINGSQLYALTRPLRFGGDNSVISNQDGKPSTDTKVIARSSNQAIDIKGGESEDTKLTQLTDKNIGVIVRDTNSMEVLLAKNLNGLESAKFGPDNDQTVINKDGITITNKDNTKPNVSLTDTGLNNGNNQIINVASGLGNTELENAQGDTLRNGVNVGDLKNAVNNVIAKGFGLKDESGDEIKQNLGTTIQVIGDSSITTNVTTKANGDKALEIGLNSTVTVGNDTKPGTITVKGENGKDGVSINGKDGSIGLTGPVGKDGKDVKATISLTDGTKGLDGNNGKDGESKTRITYVPIKPDGSNGDPEEVATLNDGLKFGANTGDVHNAKLNTQVNVTGAVANKDWSKFDAGKNVMTQVEGSNITIALAKNPEFEGLTLKKDDNVVNFTTSTPNTLTLGGKVENGGKAAPVTITNVNSTLTPTYNNINPGTTPTKSATLPPTLKAEDYSNAATVGDVLNAGWNLQGNGTAADFVKPYDTINFVDGGNTKAVVAPNDNGLISNISINVVGLPVQYTLGDTPVVKVGDKYFKVDAEGKPTGDALTAEELAKLSTNLVAPNSVNTIGTAQTLGNLASSIKNQEGDNFIQKLANATTANPNNAVNVSDLNSTVSALTNSEQGGGFGLKDESGKEVKQDLGKSIPVIGDGSITTNVITNENNEPSLQIGLNSTVTIGNDTKPGTITVKGVDGKDGVSINGKDGSIGLNGKDGSNATFTFVQGPAGVDGKGSDGKPGTNTTRIEYTPTLPDGTKGQPEQVATLNDGLKFGANTGEVHNAKLNTQVNVTGAVANKDWSKFDAGKNVMTQVEGSNITIALAKNPEFEGLTLKKDDNVVNFTTSTPNTLTLGGKVENGGKAAPVTITNVNSTLAPTYNNVNPLTNQAETPTKSAILPPTLKAEDYSNAATVGDVLNAGWNLQGNGTAADFVKPYDTVNFIDGTGTTVEVKASEDGKTSTVQVNTLVELVDVSGNPVKKAKDGKYYPKDQVNADGSVKEGAKEVTNLQVNVVNPAAPDSTKTAIQLGNIAKGTNTYADKAATADGKPLVNVNGKLYNPEDFDATTGILKADAKEVTNGVEPSRKAVQAKAGLADLEHSNQNNAMTVADARNLGWVVSGKGTDGTDYAKAVKNADEVNFVGKGFANVTVGQNKDTGAQEITVDVKVGEVIKENEGIATIDNEKVEVVKTADGNYYKKSDIDPATGEPKPGVTPLTPEQVATVENNGSGLVTGHKVAEAIQKSGWTIGKTTAEEAAKVTYKNEDEKVNPNDNVRFADGKNTVTSLGTVKKLDAEGNIVTTTTVKVDVDLPIDFKYTDAAGKEYVKTEDGKFYAKDKVIDGVPMEDAVALTDTQIGNLKKGAQLTNGINQDGISNDDYAVKDPIQAAVQQAAEKAVADTLTANPNASAADIADAVKTATDKARIDAIKANPEAKDTITAGTGGVNLDNVAWAEKPNQAVNKDQLDQTVNKAGFFVEQNGKSTIAGKPTEKVTPNDVVNFANGANTVVTAETVRDDATGADKTTVTVNVNGLPVTYTTKVDGKDVPVVKVGDTYYQVGADGKADTTKPVEANNLSTNLVNPAAGKNEIGAPTQLGNVANGANTFTAPQVDGKDIKLANDGKWYAADQVNPNGTLKDGAEDISEKVQEALKNANNGGLVDFANSNPNNVATVGDLQNLGFNVGTSENGYTDQVRNNSKVDFVGDKKYISVTGKTNDDGTREIKVSLKEGEVIKSNEFTITNNGKDVEVIAIPEKDQNGNVIIGQDGKPIVKYYDKDDIDPTTGEPKSPNVAALVPDANTPIVNKGDGLVTGNKVADAIQKSSWTIGKTTAEEAAKVTYKNEDEKVNPNDNVRFADGKNTVTSLGTVKKLDAEGNIVTTTTVKVDVDLPIDFKYTDAAGKEYVKANDGKFYARDKVGVDGYPSVDGTALTDEEVSNLKKGAQLTDGLNADGQPNDPYAVKDPIQVAAEKAVAELLKTNPKATAADILKTAEDAKAAAIKANPEAKDTITAGTGGVNLDNVAWAEKPNQAVNKDQLDQTVNKAGFFVEQNGKSTIAGKPTEKVTPNDVVNFANGANTVVTAETVRDDATGADKTTVTVNVNGLPVTYTTKVDGKDVPVVKVGDTYYQVGADGKADTTKPVEANNLSTNLVNPAAGKNEIGAPTQLGNVANGANTFTAPQVDGKDIKLANDGKWYAADQVNPNGTLKDGAEDISEKVQEALKNANNGGLVDFANSNPNNVATVGDLQNLGFMVSTADDQYKEQVRNNNRVEFASGNKNAKVTGSTRADGTREVKVTLSDTPVFTTVQVGGDNGPKIGSTAQGDLVVSKQDGSAARITNVAPGIENNDAVNVGQLKGAVNTINNRMNKINKDLRAGIAGSNAAAGLPQVYIPGKSMVAAAAGTFKGQSAVAVGYSRASDNGKLILKLQGNANTRGDVGASVGMGYQW